jgi:fructan beta-fructosidase
VQRGDEEFRPQYHYTSEQHQINDPNGLLWYAGEYHLFYQYNIDGAVHWGHAVSTDLLHWERLEPALYPDEIGNIWSGSAVVDERNSSGLQDGDEKVLVAIFTYSEHSDGKQSQGLAYSNDKGRTWTKHPANPIVPNTGQKDFRDPKVFWHQGSNKWIMVVSIGDQLEFHTSANLIDWARAGTFGRGHGSHGGAWECPDLFQLPVEGTQEHRWVLSVSITDGAPAGGSGMQYFIGDFDGDTFHNENSPDTTLWQNFGKDYYAGVTWGDQPFPDNRRLMIAWTDNWQYREIVPTEPFNGQLSLVRELQLRRYNYGIRLIQNPAAEYTQLRQWLGTWSAETISKDNNLLQHIDGDCLEISMTIDVRSSTCSEVGVDLRTGPGQRTRVGYNVKTEKMYVDRAKSGKMPERDGKDIGATWASIYEAHLAPENGRIALRVLLDRSSLELFGNEREQISTLILPSRDNTGLATYTDGEAKIEQLTLHRMTNIFHR